MILDFTSVLLLLENTYTHKYIDNLNNQFLYTAHLNSSQSWSMNNLDSVNKNK